MSKQLPRQQGAETEDWIRNSIGRHFGEATKEQAKNEHHEKRLNDGPGCAQYRLFVANFDIAPGQEVQQLAILPQFAKTDCGPTTRRVNAERGKSVLGGTYRLRHRTTKQ